MDYSATRRNRCAALRTIKQNFCSFDEVIENLSDAHSSALIDILRGEVQRLQGFVGKIPVYFADDFCIQRYIKRIELANMPDDFAKRSLERLSWLVVGGQTSGQLASGPDPFAKALGP